MINAFPLDWPMGWPRTPAHLQRHAPFKVTPKAAETEMLAEIKRLGGTDVIVSSDQPKNRDGSLSANRKRPDDVGVAVHFKRKGQGVVFACDKYTTIHDNVRAIGKTVEALRGIERWGASDMLERAFTGFTALAAPEQWWQVLGVPESASADKINSAYRIKAISAHPDNGGSNGAMSRLNVARDQGLGAIS